jgi:putative ATP-dependent endonuclease of OLD family
VNLSKVIIENFRGFKRIEVDLDSITVLIGENNTGKSAFLDAIRLCLSRPLSRRGNPFEDHDYYLPTDKSSPGDAGKLSVTLDFAETKKGEWVPDIVQALPDVAVLHGDLYHVTFRLTSEFDKGINDFVVDWDFLDPTNKPIPRGKRTQVLVMLQQLNPVHYLSALRDAARDFQARSSFWAPFLRNPVIPAAAQKQLEKDLETLNEKILQGEPRLKKVVATLSEAQKIVSLGAKDTVSIQAVPTKVWEMLSRAQVNVAGVTGANLPLGRHGAGTQSLAVIFLFRAFLESGLGGADALSSPVLEIEEPEAHLHPGAIRVLWTVLETISGQKLIATHSGDLLSETPLSALRRFRRKGGDIELRKLDPKTLNADELRKVHFHIRRTRAELLFARCWLLVEGETDYWILTECAKVLGESLEASGVRIVDYRLAGASPFAKVADDFGIEWHCVCDGDAQGKATRSTLVPLLKGRAEKDHICSLPHESMELLLCNSGYGGVYETNVSPQKKAKITAKAGDPQYWHQVLECQQDKYKVRCATQVCAEIAKKGKAGVPKEMKTVIDASVKLANR